MYHYNPQGIGFAGLLTILFIALWLWKAINWAWVWVFSPLWISVIVMTAIIAIVLIRQNS